MNETKEKNRLKINIIASIVSTLVGLGIAFVFTPFLVDSIGKETYSFYPIANNIVNYFTIIVTAFNALASRFITIAIVQNEREKAQEYSSSILLTNLILVAIFIIPMAIIVYKADTIFDITENDILNIKCLFIFVFSAMLINVVGSVYGVATFVKERIDIRAYQQLIVSFLRIVLYFALFTLFEPSIIFVGIVTFIESIFNFIIQFYLTKKLMPEYQIRLSFAKVTAAIELLSSGIWSSISSLGSNLLTGFTLIFTNIMFGSVASGYLSIAQTLPNLCTTLITMMISVFYPRLTNQYALTDKEGLAAETYKSQKIMGVIISTPIVLLIGMGREFFSLWMPHENAVALQTASIIYLIPYIIQANMWTITQVFPVMNKVQVPAITMVFFGIMNMILCYSVPRLWECSYYIIPCISSVLNVLYCIIFVPLFASKYLSCSPKQFYSHLTKAALASITTLIATNFICSLINCTNWLIFILCGGICAVVGYFIFLLLTLNNTDRKSLMSVLNR